MKEEERNLNEVIFGSEMMRMWRCSACLMSQTRESQKWEGWERGKSRE
jgi:hypothetical protein